MCLLFLVQGSGFKVQGYRLRPACPAKFAERSGELRRGKPEYA